MIKNTGVQCWLGFLWSVSLFPCTLPLQTKNSIKAIKMVMLGMNGAHPPSSTTSCTKLCRLFPLHVEGGGGTPSVSKWKLPLPKWKKRERSTTQTTRTRRNQGSIPAFSAATARAAVQDSACSKFNGCNCNTSSACKLRSSRNAVDLSQAERKQASDNKISRSTTSGWINIDLFPLNSSSC